jgi:hypothetical protein
MGTDNPIPNPLTMVWLKLPDDPWMPAIVVDKAKIKKTLDLIKVECTLPEESLLMKKRSEDTVLVLFFGFKKTWLEKFLIINHFIKIHFFKIYRVYIDYSKYRLHLFGARQDKFYKDLKDFPLKIEAAYNEASQVFSIVNNYDIYEQL